MKLSEQFKHMAELAEAQEAGKQLQFNTTSSGWVDIQLRDDDLAGNADHWRIKPAEPKRVWINEYPKRGCAAHHSWAVAMSAVQDDAARAAVPFIELTPDVAEKLGIDDE